MRVEVRRDALLIIHEGDIDRAFIEDTLGLKTSGATITLTRVPEVQMGYVKGDNYVLKTTPETDSNSHE